jgi:hypothetical protein
LAALREYGPTPLHRQSFAPVWQNPVPQEAFEFMDEAEIAEDEPGLSTESCVEDVDSDESAILVHDV